VVLIGRIMIASTTPAVSEVLPVTEAGPAKNGRNPRLSSSQLWTGTRYGARFRAPQRPKTTDGTAASRSMR
jgi:hypothetical protein